MKIVVELRQQVSRALFVKTLLVQIFAFCVIGAGLLIWGLPVQIFPLFLGLCFSWMSFLSTQLIIERWLTRKSMGWTNVFIVLKYVVLSVGLYILVQSYSVLSIGLGFFMGTVVFVFMACQSSKRK